MKRSREEEEDESRIKRLNDRLDSADAVKLFENRILTNPSITDLIFADIGYSELLDFSLASKAWNLTCRGILVDRFKTYFTLSERITLGRLIEFHDLISNVAPGNQLPINGIRIKFDYPVCEWHFSSEHFADLLRRIVEKIEVKCVSFDMSMMHLATTEFSKIFKTLLIPHLGTIKFLEILNFDAKGNNLKSLSQQLTVDSLPTLQELNFGNSQERLKLSTLKRILRACPNLKSFPAVFPYQLPTLRHTRNLRLASKVRFNYMRLTSMDLQLLQYYSALIKHLDVNQNSKHRRNQYENDFISRLGQLFASHLQYNLESFHIDLEPLIAIIILQRTFPPLPKVKELCVRGGQRWFPCLYRNKAVRFAQFLPNLESVTFSWTWKYSRWLHRKYGSEDEEGDGVPLSLLEGEIPASMDSVTTLRLHGLKKWEEEKSINEDLMKVIDLNEVFPRVTYLDIQMDISGLEDLLKWICESWGELLETLVLRKIKCLGFYADESSEESEYEELQELKRKPLRFEEMYSDTLCHLKRLELEFCHPFERDSAGNYVEDKVKVQDTFQLHTGQRILLVVSGCRAKKRLQSVDDELGLSVYDTILALHSCPRNLELSPMEEIIANKSICRNICKMLPTPDLLRCFLVNQSWNAVARDVLYEDRSCTLILNPITFGGQGISAKLTWLEEGNQKPFNQLKLQSNCRWFQRSNYSASLDATSRYFETADFSHTTFKELHVPGLDETYQPSSISEFDEQTTLLIKFFKPVLQQLNLDRVQKLVTSIEIFDELFRDEEGFLLVPNLKIIEFFKPERLLDYPQVFKHLLADVYCLERIEVPFSNKLLPLVTSRGEAHWVKHIQLYKFPENETFVNGDIFPVGGCSGAMRAEDPGTALGSLLKFVEERKPRIETLCIGVFLMLHQQNESAFRRALQQLCCSSSDSLRSLDTNITFLFYISRLITRPLQALKQMTLLFHADDFDPHGLLTQIPFWSMAPDLEHVKLSRSISYVPGSADSSSSIKFPPCSSVKSMELELLLDASSHCHGLNYPSPEPAFLEYFAGVFPRITKLSIFSSECTTPESSGAFTAALRSVWSYWPSLELVKIDADGLDAVSLETLTLGISKEEWNVWNELQYQEYSQDLVSSMHYAPSSFSIRNCKNLKELRIKRGTETRLLRATSRFPRLKSWIRVCLTRNSSD